MNEQFHRVTKRFLQLPDETATLPVQYSNKSKVFRVTHVRETLGQGVDGETYEVQFTGPVVTTKGADHAVNSGTATYQDRRFGKPISEVPEALMSHLAGPDALRAAFDSKP